jgi:hypothetical protein
MGDINIDHGAAAMTFPDASYMLLISSLAGIVLVPYVGLLDVLFICSMWLNV